MTDLPEGMGVIYNYEVKWQHAETGHERTNNVTVGDTVRKGYSSFADIPKIIGVMFSGNQDEKIIILNASLVSTEVVYL